MESSLQEKTGEYQQQQSDLNATLDDADVKSVAAYAERVEEMETQEARRSQAETILTRELGEPDADTPEGKISYWGSELASRRSAVDDASVDADHYEEAEVEQREQKQSDLESQLDKITTKLNDHRDRFDTFERRATELSPPPFVSLCIIPSGTEYAMLHKVILQAGHARIGPQHLRVSRWVLPHTEEEWKV